MLGKILLYVAIIRLVKSEKSKPVEKRGRKAKGLKSRPTGLRQPGCRRWNREFFASLVQNQALFVGTLHNVRSIKANPLKNGDAKPRVYHPALRDHDSRVADVVPERVSEIIAGYFECLYRRGEK